MRAAAWVVVAAAAGLAGCKTFENRLTTTLQADRAYVTSMWGPVGLTTELSPEDTAELRRLLQRPRSAQNAP